jgi:simple sugar transport system permease protein
VLPFATDLGELRIRDIRELPALQLFYSDVISGHSILTYAAVLAVALSWWCCSARASACGCGPWARTRRRWTRPASRSRGCAMRLWDRGAAVRPGGAQLSTAEPAAGFVRDMTAGRGYIALAALIFAKWRPVAALWACLLFGFLQALALRRDLRADGGACASRRSSSMPCPTS